MSEDAGDLLEEWYRDYAGRVMAYLLHRTDYATAQDLVHEVFIVAFRKHADVPRPPIGWLFATARKLLANKDRGRRRHDLLVQRLSEDAAQTSSVEDLELKLRFADALSVLSAKDREVLTLTAWYGLTPAEAAQALGCSPGAYSVRLHRARTRLADFLHASGRPGQPAVVTLAEALND